MPAKHASHIALSGPLAEWAKAQVAKGEYSSLSELIRTAMRQLRERDEALHGAMQQRQEADLRV